MKHFEKVSFNSRGPGDEDKDGQNDDDDVDDDDDDDDDDGNDDDDDDDDDDGNDDDDDDDGNDDDEDDDDDDDDDGNDDDNVDDDGDDDDDDNNDDDDGDDDNNDDDDGNDNDDDGNYDDEDCYDRDQPQVLLLQPSLLRTALNVGDEQSVFETPSIRTNGHAFYRNSPKLSKTHRNSPSKLSKTNQNSPQFNKTLKFRRNLPKLIDSSFDHCGSSITSIIVLINNWSGRVDQIVSGGSQRLPTLSKEVLQKKRPHLEKYIRLNDLLYENARLLKIIPDAAASELFNLENDHSSTRANAYFIDFLIKSRDEEKWEVFLEAVRNSDNQDLLRDILFDTNPQELQRHKRQEALIQNITFWNELLQILDASEFLLRFSFKDFNRERINCCKKRHGNKAANVLILKSIIKYKGWFSKLLEILRDMGHHRLATALQDADNEGNADGPAASAVAGNTRSQNRPVAPLVDNPDRAARALATCTHHHSNEATMVKVFNSLSLEEKPPHRDCASTGAAERAREIGFRVMKQRQEQANQCRTLPEKNAFGLSKVPDSRDRQQAGSTTPFRTPKSAETPRHAMSKEERQKISLTRSCPVAYRCSVCTCSFMSQPKLHEHEMISHSRISKTSGKQKGSTRHAMFQKKVNNSI
ncbi:replicase polyprotein 1a [Plakobranchus ocellatus]|uniref:Replicase polyprotein 1a n=1 Tax=Plakobranchus ocellatus TaxID=259542 RepID=A0AAV3Z4V3_9GAST|nr:replicase polyprotein 1a [Plakobranchus ocellatus]